MNQQDSLHTRIQVAIAHLDASAVLMRSWPLKGGISSLMTGIEVCLQDGSTKKMIARQPGKWRFSVYPNAAEIEARAIREAGLCGVPVPQIFYVEPQSEAVPMPLFLLEFIEGAPVLSPEDKSSYVRAYAACLAKIHGVDLRDRRFSFLSAAKEEFQGEGSAVNVELREPEIRHALAQWRGSAESGPKRLLHGDFWPGNIIWKEGSVSGVIDWEESGVGEPLQDLSVARLDLLWTLGVEAMKEFTDAYLSLTPLDPRALSYWDLVASLRPVSNLAEWAGSYPGLGRPDVTESTMTEGHQVFVEQALCALT